MAGVPPKKNTAYTFYTGLEDKANPGLFKASPTLAAGDWKIAIDDGAPANLATLPVVDADFTKRVKVALSSDEMNGDHITIIASDAAGAEWYDLQINIDTDSKQIGDIPAAAPSAATIAAEILVIPANKLGTDDSGRVAFVPQDVADALAYAPSSDGDEGSIYYLIGQMPTAVDNATATAAAILATPAYKIATLSGGEIVISPETVVAAYVENLSPTAQQEASNGVNNLAPAGSGATGSIRAKLDAIKLITDAIDTSAVTVTSSNNAGVLTFTRGVTFAATVSGLTISATWAKLYFTLKESDYDTDEMSLLQLVVTNPAAALTDGLLYLDGSDVASPVTKADGTLTVSQAAGTVAIAITDNATVWLSKASGLVWDIKTKDTAGATAQNATGTASIGRAITQTI